MADSESRSSLSDIRSRISELDAHILALKNSLATTRREREKLESPPSGRDLRSDLRATISVLDARILAIENSLAAERREREKLQSQLDDYRYPVFILPEITSEIFFHFLPIYPLRSPLSGLLSPALLGQICRSWRDVALGTPRLWSAIEIHISCEDPDLFSARVDLLQTWLARSKTCSLSLSVQIRLYPHHDGSQFSVLVFLFLLLPHRAQAFSIWSETKHLCDDPCRSRASRSSSFLAVRRLLSSTY
jgi:hypothetical protein